MAKAKRVTKHSAKRREYAGEAVTKAKRPTSLKSPPQKKTVQRLEQSGNGEPAGAPERLSPQERFCRLIAIDDYLPLEAYMKAFGWDGSPADARKSAYGLIQVPEIERRIEELRPPLVEGVEPGDMLSLEQHLKELYALERLAIAHGQIGAAIQAAVYRGKASGLYVERIAVAHMNLEDLIARSREDGRIESVQQLERIAAPKKNGAKHASGRPLLSGPKERVG